MLKKRYLHQSTLKKMLYEATVAVKFIFFGMIPQGLWCFCQNESVQGYILTGWKDLDWTWGDRAFIITPRVLNPFCSVLLFVMFVIYIHSSLFVVWIVVFKKLKKL